MPHPLPNRAELVKVINGLIEDTSKRHEVAAWAFAIVDDPEEPIRDWVLWDVLTALGGADIIAFPAEGYLYGAADFQDWRSKLA